MTFADGAQKRCNGIGWCTSLSEEIYTAVVRTCLRLLSRRTDGRLLHAVRGRP